MKKETFEIIKTNLEARLSNCNKYLGNVKTTDDLLNMTVVQLRDLKAFCKKEVQEMTQICMVDLYHILGMGNLTVQQTNTFLKLFRAYTKFRPDMKSLSVSLNSIESLPKIPTGSKFKLLQLGDVTLYAGDQEKAEEDTSSVEDYTQAKKESEKQKIEELLSTEDTTVDSETTGLNSVKLCGSVVTFKTEDINLFLAAIGIQKNLIQGYAANLLTKAKNKGKYLGLSWSFNATGDGLIGIVGTSGCLSDLKEKLK